MKKLLFVIIMMATIMSCVGCGKDTEYRTYELEGHTVMTAVTEYSLFGSETKYYDLEWKELEADEAITAYAEERICDKCHRLIVGDWFENKSTGIQHCAYCGDYDM